MSNAIVQASFWAIKWREDEHYVGVSEEQVEVITDLSEAEFEYYWNIEALAEAKRS